MKIARWAWILLAAAPFVTGCGDFWQAPSGSSSSSGCSSDCTTATSGDFYILNGGTTPEIVGESIASGTLTAISGSPWSLVSTPYAMAIAPSGNFLYVSTTAGVYVYPISSGALGTPTEITADNAVLALQVDTTGDWLLEAIQVTGGVTVAAVPVNPSTGLDDGSELSATFSVTNAAVQQGKMVITPDDDYILIALGQGGTIVVPFNAASPLPSGITAMKVPVINSGGSALSVGVDPDKRLFYIGETLADSAGTSGGLRAFLYSSLSAGTLTQASGSPIASGGLAPNFILPVASGDDVYVANGQGAGTTGNITGFSITTSSSTYAIATGSAISAGTQPYALAEDSTDTFVLAVSESGSPYFDAYTFDSSTAGKLDAQITADTGALPLAIVAAP